MLPIEFRFILQENGSWKLVASDGQYHVVSFDLSDFSNALSNLLAYHSFEVTSLAALYKKLEEKKEKE